MIKIIILSKSAQEINAIFLFYGNLLCCCCCCWLLIITMENGGGELGKQTLAMTDPRQSLDLSDTKDLQLRTIAGN